MATTTFDKPVGSNQILTSDVVDNLTTNDGSKVLSAAQGYTLNSKISTQAVSISSASELSTFLENMLNSLETDQHKEVRVAITTAFSVFEVRSYAGTVYKIGTSGLTAKVMLYANGIQDIIYCYRNSGSEWTYGKVASIADLNAFETEHTYHFKRKSLPRNGTCTFSFQNWSSGLFIVTAFAQTRFGMYLICNNNSDLSNREVVASSVVSVSSSNGVVTFSNSSESDVFILYMTLSGIIT